MLQQNAFYRIDFSEIDDFDPSLGEGHRVLYDREIPTYIKYQNKYAAYKEMPNPEQLNVRILMSGQDDNPKSIKVEVFCENDLFFAFYQESNQTSYNAIKLAQHLEYSFREYPRLCISSLNKCLEPNESSKYKAQLIMMQDGSGRLEVVQSTEFKNIQMITIDLSPYNDDFIRQRVLTKYHQVRTSLIGLGSRFKQIQLK